MALTKLAEIPSSKRKIKDFYRSAYIGTCSHPIIEDIYRRGLSEYITEHELYFNLPRSYHQIDTSIDLKDSKGFLKLDLELAKKYGIKLDGIEEIFIDYTIPSTSSNAKFDKNVLGKLDKYCQDPKGLFITAFYGFYSSKAFKMVEERIGDYVKDNNIVASENTKYMNVVELAKLLNLEKKYIEEIEDLDNLIKKAIMKDDNALEKLEILSEEAITRLRKNNKYCNRLLRPKKGKK